MIEFVRTKADNPDFINLVNELDDYLTVTDGDEHNFYHQFNGLQNIHHVILGFENNKAVACGAIKEQEPGITEVKRMYTKPNHRGLGIASKLLEQLEIWAKELGYQKCRLETGNRQLEAVRLYHKSGSTVIPNYGQYKGVKNSICFEKTL